MKSKETSSVSVSLAYSTKSELVYQHLREMIVNGKLPAGTHLYLAEIAQSLGVSTNPVREAFRRLESEGLIANRPHAGATVSAIDVEKIEVHFEIRGVLEGLAVRLVASHLTDDAMAQLDSWDRRLVEFAAAHDFTAWNEANIAFHRFLFSLSRSLELIAMIDLQRDRSPRYRHFPEVLAIRARESDDERQNLLGALRDRDGEAAERIQRAITSRVGALLCAAMRRPTDVASALLNGAAGETRHDR
jgi:DNA-binding GntR family transcriptional regulator